VTTLQPPPPSSASPLPPAVDGLLWAFAQSAPARACADPAGAYANCLALSARCGQALRAAGVACGLLHLAGSLEPMPHGVGRWAFCDPAVIQHWTVRVGEWSMDWTARQFRAEADWPEVEPVGVLAARWRLVEDWACPRCTELVAHPLHMELTPAGLEREHRAVARATSGRGPFRDPRHDDTPALVRPCACPPGPDQP
jgi:hypothetical protein